jgi:hypothetical protein
MGSTLNPSHALTGRNQRRTDLSAFLSEYGQSKLPASWRVHATGVAGFIGMRIAHHCFKPSF